MRTSGPGWSLLRGDSLEVLPKFAEGRFDACVCDPPYELGFMGKTWDASGIAFSVEFWRTVLRVLKPGAHLLAFGATRTYHRMACAIEDAGFEVRDSLHWFYGTGFPKSLNVGSGRGTALKPGHEPVVLARKPLVGTVAENLEAHGVGALNIDTCRIAATDGRDRSRRNSGAKGKNAFGHSETYDSQEHPGGRWPANVLLDEGAAAELDAQSGDLKAGGKLTGNEPSSRAGRVAFDTLGPRPAWAGHGDSGGASRFFYVAKPSRSERDAGCEALPLRSGGEVTGREDDSAGTQSPRAGAGRTGGARNHHPTVKPVALMRHLVRLVTPPGGCVLDPFAGSGTTGIAALLEDRGFVGVEREAEYATIAVNRIRSAHACREN